MKLDFTKIVLVGVDGKPFEEQKVHQTIANILYRSAQNLDLVNLAMDIHQGKEVDMHDAEIKELRSLIKNPQNGMFAFAQKAIFDYIDSQEKK